MTYHDDFAFEPVPGLPAHLPRGESVLWRGSPQWRSLAWRGMYVRPVAIYFLILMVWRVGEGLGGGGSLIASTVYALNILPVALAALGVLVFLAYAYARSTIYTITNRRVVIRSGVALPVTVNLPFNVIENAALRLTRDGSGDIPLRISKSQRVYSLALWPNLRPWNFSRPEPMLRCIPEAKRAAAILGKALGNSLPSDNARAPATVRGAQLAPPRASASGAHAGEPAVASRL
jgi:Bacterial PH domain